MLSTITRTFFLFVNSKTARYIRNHRDPVSVRTLRVPRELFKGMIVYGVAGAISAPRDRARPPSARANGGLRLEALAVDDGRSALVVLLLRDPHLLEGRQRGQNGTTDPDGVLALGRRDDLDTHARGRERGELLLHTVRDTREHRGTTRKDDVAVEITTDIEITLVDGVVTGTFCQLRLDAL